MAWDTNDLWWLKPQASSDHSQAISHGLALGFQMSKQRQDQEIQLKQLEVSHYNNFLAQRKYKDQLDDQPLLNEFALNPGGPIPRGFKSPESFQTAQQLQGLWLKSEAGMAVNAAADEYYKKLAELSGKDRIRIGSMMGGTKGRISPEIADAIDLAYGNRPQEPTANMRDASEISRLESELASLPMGAPRRQEVETTLAMMKAKQIGASRRTEVNPDGSVIITEGGAGLTTATLGQAQQRILAGEKAVSLAANMLSQLTDSSIGIKGNMNQLLVNEGLAQLFPGMFKGEVAEGRTLMGKFGENVKKAITSDPRISNYDDKRIQKFIGNLGPNESLPSYQTKVLTLVNEMRGDARRDAEAAGVAVPDYAWTAQEIKAKLAAGEWTKEKAMEVFRKYFSNIELAP